MGTNNYNIILLWQDYQQLLQEQFQIQQYFIIEKIIDINYHDLIINKKIYLIDRELKKNHKKESYLDINDIEIQKILYSLNQEECINEEQKLFLKNLIEYNDNKSEKKL